MGAENAECHCAKIGTSRYFFRLRLVSAHGCHFLICGFAKRSSARTWWLAGKVLNSPDFGAAGSHAGAWSSFAVAPRASIRRPKSRFGSKCEQKGLSGVYFSPESAFLQRQGTGGIAEKESYPSRPTPFANAATVHQALVWEEHGGARQRKDGPRDFQQYWRSHERGREVHPRASQHP